MTFPKTGNTVWAQTIGGDEVLMKFPRLLVAKFQRRGDEVSDGPSILVEINMMKFPTEGDEVSEIPSEGS